jgi:hypothetical protein
MIEEALVSNHSGRWWIKTNVLNHRSIPRTYSLAEAIIHKAASNAELNQRAALPDHHPLYSSYFIM